MGVVPLFLPCKLSDDVGTIGGERSQAHGGVTLTAAGAATKVGPD